MNASKSLLTVLLCLSIGIINTSCKNWKKMKTEIEAFRWYASVTGPDKYPFKLLPSIFVYDDNEEGGYVFLQSVNFSRGRWGEPGGFMGGKAPIPHTLDITWLSWVEAKVYTGSFKLPTDTITKLFRAGYTNFKNQRADYDCILAGLGPEGVVIVWVWAPLSCVEVARFQAVEKKGVTVQEISPTAEEKDLKKYCNRAVGHRPDIVEYIAKRGLNSQFWDIYRERFQMRFLIQYFGKKKKQVTDQVNIKYLNGEFQCLNYEYLQENPFVYRARPQFMEVYFSVDQNLYEFDLTFDEEEIMAAYDQIYGNNPDGKAEIVLDLWNDSIIQKLVLRGMEREKPVEVKLHKTEIIKYRLDESYRPNFRIFQQNNAQ